MLNMRACFEAETAASRRPSIDFSGKFLMVSSKQKAKTKLRGWMQITEIILATKVHLEVGVGGGEIDSKMGANMIVTM